MNSSERIAYLKGLAEGLGIKSDDKEGKMILGILGALEELALDVEDLEETTIELSEELEDLSDDVSDLAENLVELEECCEEQRPKRRGFGRHGKGRKWARFSVCDDDECDCCEDDDDCCDDDECDCCCDDDDDDEGEHSHDHEHEHGHEHEHDHSHDGHKHVHADGEECDCDDDEPLFFEAECPSCGAGISIDEAALSLGKIICPNCGELLEFDVEEEE